MAVKKVKSDLEIDGQVTTDSIVETGGGTPSTVFLTNGQTAEKDAWATLEW